MSTTFINQVELAKQETTDNLGYQHLRYSTYFRKQSCQLFKDYMAELIKHTMKDYHKFKEQKLRLKLLILYYISAIFLSLCSVVLYIAMTEIYDQVVLKNLLLADLILSCIFIVELIFIFLRLFPKSSFLLNVFVWIQIITIAFSFTSFILNQYLLNFSFLRILRTLQFVKIPKLLNNYLELFKHTHGKEWMLVSDVKRKLLKLILIIVSLIIIGASLISKISNYKPLAFSLQNMNFIDAFYYVVITITTVGTGDIIPMEVEYRYVVLILLICLIYFIADGIARIVNLMSKKSKIIKYNFTDHIIILGDINHPDRHFKRLDNFLDYLIRSNRYKIPKIVILLLERDENEANINSLEELANKYKYENKNVFCLFVEDYNIHNLRRANFDKAKYFFFLNYNTELNNTTTDSILLMNINHLIFYIRKLDIGSNIKLFCQFLNMNYNKSILYSNYGLSLRNDLVELSFFRLTECILVKSMFARGFSTFITNLFIDTKLEFYDLDRNAFEKNYILSQYLRGLNQTLHVYRLPKCFVGLKFCKVSEFVYSKSVEFKQKALTPGERDQFTEVILLGLVISEKPELEICDSCLIRPIKDIKFNPYKRVINNNDYGLFIVDNDSKKLFVQFIKFLEDSLLLEKKNDLIIISQSELTNDPVKKILGNISFNNTIELINYLNVKNKSRDNENKSNVIQKTYFDNIFDIDEDTLNTTFKNHILIFGYTDFISDLIYKLRTHFIIEPILIVSDVCYKNISRDINKIFTNIYFVNADFLQINTLIGVKAKHAKFAIVLNDSKDVSIPEDKKAILLVRLLDEHFVKHYIVELSSYESINYLSSLPIGRYYFYRNKCLYPKYFRGSILFNPTIDKFIARVYSEPTIINCLKSLIELDFSNRYNKVSNAMKKHEVDFYLKAKIKIFNIKIGKHYHLKTYQELAKDLFANDLLPLGLYIKKSLNKENILADVEIYGQSTLQAQKQKLVKAFKNIVSNEYSSLDSMRLPIFITNPPHDFTLDMTMQVMVIGKYPKIAGKL
jgi:voltage-gated potassium channel